MFYRDITKMKKDGIVLANSIQCKLAHNGNYKHSILTVIPVVVRFIRNIRLLLQVSLTLLFGLSIVLDSFTAFLFSFFYF